MAHFKPDTGLYPFQSHWLALNDGARIHYVDEGSGPVLLLLHGNPAWSFLYRKIIPRLSKRFRCIAPDLPGFGLSQPRTSYGFTAQEQAETITAFIDQLDLHGVGVMMQDWGGPIGFYAAQARPDRIERLIIGNTFAWPFSRFGPRFFSALMGGVLGQISAYAFNGVVRFFFTKGVVKKLSRDVLNMYLAPFQKRAARRPTHIFPKQLTAASSFLIDVEKGLSKIAEKPALILWGDKDFAFKSCERSRFKQAFPNHLDITLHGAGHFIQEDAPELICSEIEAWYATLEQDTAYS